MGRPKLSKAQERVFRFWPGTHHKPELTHSPLEDRSGSKYTHAIPTIRRLADMGLILSLGGQHYAITPSGEDVWRGVHVEPNKVTT